MNVNFGLFPAGHDRQARGRTRPLEIDRKTIAKKRAITSRALEDLEAWAAVPAE